VKQFATAFLPAPQACAGGRPRKVCCYYWVLFRVAAMELGQLRPDSNRENRRAVSSGVIRTSGPSSPIVIGDLPCIWACCHTSTRFHLNVLPIWNSLPRPSFRHRKPVREGLAKSGVTMEFVFVSLLWSLDNCEEDRCNVLFGVIGNSGLPSPIAIGDLPCIPACCHASTTLLLIMENHFSGIRFLHLTASRTNPPNQGSCCLSDRVSFVGRLLF